MRYLRDREFRWPYLIVVVAVLFALYGAVSCTWRAIDLIEQDNWWWHLYAAACLLELVTLIGAVTHFRIIVRRTEKRRLTRRTPDHVG